MAENTTPYEASAYDESVRKTIPYYETFTQQAISLVKAYGQPKRWLDVGCGTGYLLEQATKDFSDAQFYGADPSEEMLEGAAHRLGDLVGQQVTLLPKCTSQQVGTVLREKVQVVTAIQVHHYLQPKERREATLACYESLEEGGIYISFENVKPLSELGIKLGLSRWGEFQLQQGRTKEAVEKHMSRFNKAYFPITVLEHLQLLEEVGFKSYEIIWLSYMQVGMMGIK